MSKKARANLLLLITSVIWGFAFVAQKAGTSLEPFTYNGIRVLVGGIALLPVVFLFPRKEEEKAEKEHVNDTRTLIRGGIVCGIILCIASNLQQLGIYFETDAGKAGFITTLYIVIVPVLGVFLRKTVSMKMWLCVIIGAVGFYFLTMAGKGNGFRLENGDLFVLLCAFVFSLHILAVDYFSPRCDGLKLSCLHFFVAGFINLFLMFIFESPKLSEILDCWLPILYTGVRSSAAGYTFQIIAQKDADPTTASLIMSLESVFAVLAGVLIYRESLTLIELLGCVIIFTAVIVSQLPSRKEKTLIRKGEYQDV